MGKGALPIFPRSWRRGMDGRIRVPRGWMAAIAEGIAHIHGPQSPPGAGLQTSMSVLWQARRRELRFLPFLYPTPPPPRCLPLVRRPYSGGVADLRQMRERSRRPVRTVRKTRGSRRGCLRALRDDPAIPLPDLRRGRLVRGQHLRPMRSPPEGFLEIQGGPLNSDSGQTCAIGSTARVPEICVGTDRCC